MAAATQEQAMTEGKKTENLNSEIKRRDRSGDTDTFSYIVCSKSQPVCITVTETPGLTLSYAEDKSTECNNTGHQFY